MKTERPDAYGMIVRSLSGTEGKRFQENGWGKRHVDFWRQVVRTGTFGSYASSDGSAIVLMVESWARYADRHYAKYESLIGDDGVLGPEWAAIGESILALLNGECGPLDCGTVDGLVRDILAANGVEAG